MQAEYDILVVGGGINGAAVARDAAGRGARVLLVEQDDLANHTSSASTKLIHGGLRYLEHYEFRLVGEALAERERLMRSAPHLIRPLRFALPHDNAMRSAWLMRAALFIYDRLGGRSKLPRSRGLRFHGTLYGAPLKSAVTYGYVYSDCWGEDSRLVVACAQDAAAHGAEIRPRTRLEQAERDGEVWRARLSGPDGLSRQVTARILVNAAGAWAQRFLSERIGMSPGGRLRLVKGSHIVTRRLFDGEHAYMLQNPDKRIVFAIPYEEEYTLIGTTDVTWDGPLNRVEIEASEILYLCEAVNKWFDTPITPADVVWTFAGVRPLYDDAEADLSKVSRDYQLTIDASEGKAPILSIFGGKITTHRALAEHAIQLLTDYLPSRGPAWTRNATLPGGDLGADGLDGFERELAARAPFLDTATIARLARSYGSRALRIIGTAASEADLGKAFGGGLTEAEVRYLLTEEWALTAQDILWRRSKLGLHLAPSEVQRLEAWLSRYALAITAAP